MIGRYRDTEANLRTTFNKICDRAGVVRFAKPFMNCRTTRRNELDKQGTRNAALNAWFGHSKQTAEKHYDRVTEDEFSDTLSAGDAIWGQKRGQHQGIPEQHRGTTTTKKPRDLRPGTLPCPPVGQQEYTPEDSNL